MSQPYFSIINPYTQETIQNVPWSTDQELTFSMEKVSITKPKRSIQDRTHILEKLSTLLDKNHSELAKTIALETGKPIKDAILEIQRAAVATKNVSQQLTTLKGEIHFSDSSYHSSTKADYKYCLSKKVPYGVVLAIVPFNFPINLAIHKIAPAFAMENSILLKPHPQCFETSTKLIQLCLEAGMTEQDIQLIYPENSALLKIIASNMIDVVSFTGGTATAKILAAHCGIKKTLFELGGNDALVIMPDADLEKVSNTIMNQRFRCAGQRCTSPKRIFCHPSIKATLLEILIPKIKKMNIGDPLNASTDLGPVISAASKDHIIQKIKESTKQGAKVILPWNSDGNIIEPVLLDHVTPDMPVVADETFGPVASLINFSTQEEVIAMINKSRLGLQCGVFTQNINQLKDFFEKVNVGTVLANEGPAYRLDHFPFGGLQDSGHGREGTASALHEFSTIRNFIF